jgi:hypothetical protein
MTTAAKLIREKQATIIEALVPDNFTGYLFREYAEQMPFDEWADTNPQAAMRKFYIEDLATYETPLISDAVIEQVQTNFRVAIAYPKDSRYGLKNRTAAMDVIEADRHAVDHAIGLRGSANYVAGQNSCIATDSDLDDLENVWLLSYDYEIIFDRAV